MGHKTEALIGQEECLCGFLIYLVECLTIL